MDPDSPSPDPPEPTPLELTPEEFAAVSDTGRLRAKTRATATLRGHLEALREALRPRVAGRHRTWRTPPGFDPDASQIARGENLDGTPYQYLDLPKHFTGGDYFTFRTLLWWGRGVSFCWILKGGGLAAYRAGLKMHAEGLVGAGVGVWFGGDPWDWGGHVDLAAVPPDALDALGFLKVGVRVPLDVPGLLSRDGLVAAGTAAFDALEPVVRAG
jgi:hypothetical protein